VSTAEQRERGFKVPDGYFEEVQDRILHRLPNSQERGFKVPEGYFENFEVRTDGLSQKNRVLPIRKNTRARIVWMAAAASLLLFFGLKYINLGPTEPDWNSLEQTELTLWIDNELTDMTSYEIAEVYHDIELEVPVPDNTQLDEYLSEIELEQILIEN
jgi:hypothetical protein